MSQALFEFKAIRLFGLGLFTLDAGLGVGGLFLSELQPAFFDRWTTGCIFVVTMSALGFLLWPALTVRVGIFALVCGGIGAIIGGVLDSLQLDRQEQIFHIYKYPQMGELILVGEVIGAVWGLLNATLLSTWAARNRATTIWPLVWNVLKQGTILLSACLTGLVALAELSPKFHASAAATLDRLFASMSLWAS